MESLTKAFSTLFGADYYVTKQLAQIQAHYVNKDDIIKNASGSSKKVIKTIFENYEKAIDVEKWCWVKKENKLYAIPMKNKTSTNKMVKLRESERFNGIFPPIAAIKDAMEECHTENLNLNDKSLIPDELKAKVNGWPKIYNSDLEYWILQLEAFEQDMTLHYAALKILKMNTA